MKDDALSIDEDRFLKLKPKVLLWILGAVGAALTSWGIIKSDLHDIRRDVSDHSKALEQFSAQLQVIESEARKARETTAAIERSAHDAELKNQYTQDIINTKLDYLTGDKRGPRPAAGSP